MRITVHRSIGAPTAHSVRGELADGCLLTWCNAVFARWRPGFTDDACGCGPCYVAETRAAETRAAETRAAEGQGS